MSSTDQNNELKFGYFLVIFKVEVKLRKYLSSVFAKTPMKCMVKNILTIALLLHCYTNPSLFISILPLILAFSKFTLGQINSILLILISVKHNKKLGNILVDLFLLYLIVWTKFWIITTSVKSIDSVLTGSIFTNRRVKYGKLK